MARLEHLISEVPDARLRAALADEVKKLKKGKRFGLVFEEHSPETTQIPGFPVKPGARVALCDGESDDLFIVQRLSNGKKAAIVPERGGDEQTVELRQLVVVKRFGEPVYPALVPVERIVRAPGKPFHTIINADNYHALQLLLYCYEGQVDVIYIDPPVQYRCARLEIQQPLRR